VSKRSYRRLAVVAGAALAAGSMAPAMAIRLDDLDATARAAGAASVSVDAIDVSDVMGSVQSTNLSLPTSLVFGTLGGVKATLGYHAPILVGDVIEILGNVRCPVAAALDLDVVARVIATAGLNVGNGGITLGANALALAVAPLDVVEDIQYCLAQIKADVFETLVDTKAAVTTVAGLATGTALGAVATATGVPALVLGTATPLVFGTLNNLNVVATAQLAAVVSIL
jgi:hypothetical protein